MAQRLLKTGYKEIKRSDMAENEIKRNASSEEEAARGMEISYALITTAQRTISDLDRSIAELAILVECLEKNSAKLALENS